jgi:hypothetical protein
MSDLQEKLKQIREKDQHIKDIEEAIKRLKLREMLKKRELDQVVLKAKNDGRKVVIEKVKSVIPTSAPSYFKPTARALLSDLQRIIKEEEQRMAKKT